MVWRIYLAAAALFLFVNPLTAQEPPGDPVREHLFEPEEVMRNQQVIGLSEEQRSSIKKEVRSGQAKFTDLEWDLQNEMETLISLLSGKRIDEQRAVALLDKVMELESAIKQTHLILAIRIKNILTPKQQAQLRRMREPGRARPPLQ